MQRNIAKGEKHDGLVFFNEFLSDTLKRIGYIFVKSIDYIKKIE